MRVTFRKAVLPSAVSGLVLVLALGLAGCAASSRGQADAVEITFFDVGQAEAIMIRSPEGKIALIDAGEGREDVLKLLRQHGVDSVAVAIASHGHADHIGGMEHVIRGLPVQYYMDNGLPHTTATYLDLMRAVRGSDVTYLRPEARTVTLGSVRLRILPPPGVDDQNRNSLGVLLEYGAFRALFTGDSEAGELEYFVASGVPTVTVLKAAHHGSRDAVTPTWLASTDPEIVVISCGVDNPYGHPHVGALRQYEAVASTVYRTDRDGTVTVRGRRDGSYAVEAGIGLHDGP